MAVAKYLFYLYGWLWAIKPRRVGSMRDVLALFYLGFLGLNEGDVEVVKLDDFEPVCKYVLHRLNPLLAFERNYNHIRPYSDSCEERIYLKS